MTLQIADFRFQMLRRLLFPVLFLVAGFAAGLALTARLRTPADSRTSEPTASAETARPLAAAPVASAPLAAALGAMASVAPDFTGIAGQAVRGVANISSLQVVQTSNSPFANDPFFRYFFRDDQFFGSRDRRSLSLGSGVMISSDGYVVTNNHVVGDNVREITVALSDKREIRGMVVGTDPATDIALLKINVRGVPVVPWGDSSQLKVGEWVLAIGSPFQLSQTVTAGIISATGRTNVGFADYEDFIQTDAAINPGNSGGALVNARGELVGINTAIFSQSGGYQGIGFAVPSNLARRVVADLTEFGEVRRGSIGYVEIAPLSTLMAEQLGVADARGVVVQAMRRDSAAYAAGLRPGDVIVSFNGAAVADGGQLSRLIQDARIGSTAAVAIVREGRRLELKIAIASSTAG
jgi:serine protease Do